MPVQKKNAHIRVCIDYKDLSKSCPKDDFLLPLTELLVSATTSYEALSFMDKYLGYNQIQMALEDEEAIAFQTSKGIFCYKVMPFGLKNVGATYQRAITYIFEDLLHDMVECYVNDLVVITRLHKNCLFNLNQVFK